MELQRFVNNSRYHIGVSSMERIPYIPSTDAAKLYGGQGPLNNSFAALGGRICRACRKNSFASAAGVRKYSETISPRPDDETSLRCSVEQSESKLVI